MKHSRKSKVILIGDLLISCVCLLLVGHEEFYGRDIYSLFILSFPLLRIWLSFLLYRKSELAMVPIVMLLLMTIGTLISNVAYLLFVKPWITLMNMGSRLFGLEIITSDVISEVSDYVILVSLLCSIWWIIIPMAMYLFDKYKKRLMQNTIGGWKKLALCAWLFGIMIVDYVIMYETHNMTISICISLLLMMLIPIIFNNGTIKGLLTRNECAFLLTMVMFLVGYVCGIQLDLVSAMTTCTLPLAFYTLVNWYLGRKTVYVDVVLVVFASVIFWCAQYTCNMVRVMLLLISLGMMAIAVIRFVMVTQKYWAGTGLYMMMAFVMPMFCIGYNPYSVLEAKRLWHFEQYSFSKSGLLYVESEKGRGVRDRYNVILPVDKYWNVELLTPTKPYCKVGEKSKWQIYDIERQELVSDEWYSDIIAYGENVFLLKSEKDDKYLIMPKYYHRLEKEQPAIISAEYRKSDIH